jgi:hypothetical protein
MKEEEWKNQYVTPVDKDQLTNERLLRRGGRVGKMKL